MRQKSSTAFVLRGAAIGHAYYPEASVHQLGPPRIVDTSNSLVLDTNRTMARRPRESTKLEQLEVACRTRGVPLTIQRRVILEALAGRDDHPTADDIWEAVRVRMPDVSRTTAYRTLDTLVRLGLAVRICNPGSRVRFDAKTRRHHHLVCVTCERMLDIDVPALDKLALPVDKSFEITDYSVHFRGVCAACRRTRGQQKEDS